MACLLKNTSWKESGTGWSPHPQRFPQAPIHPERIPRVEFKKSSREFVAAAFLCMQNKGGQFSADLLRKAVESELLCSPAGRLKLCQQCATLNRGSRAENQYITGATERRGGHRQKMYCGEQTTGLHSNQEEIHDSIQFKLAKSLSLTCANCYLIFLKFHEARKSDVYKFKWSTTSFCQWQLVT